MGNSNCCTVKNHSIVKPSRVLPQPRSRAEGSESCVKPKQMGKVETLRNEPHGVIDAEKALEVINEA